MRNQGFPCDLERGNHEPAYGRKLRGEVEKTREHFGVECLKWNEFPIYFLKICQKSE